MKLDARAAVNCRLHSETLGMTSVGHANSRYPEGNPTQAATVAARSVAPS